MDDQLIITVLAALFLMLVAAMLVSRLVWFVVTLPFRALWMIIRLPLRLAGMVVIVAVLSGGVIQPVAAQCTIGTMNIPINDDGWFSGSVVGDYRVADPGGSMYFEFDSQLNLDSISLTISFNGSSQIDLSYGGESVSILSGDGTSQTKALNIAASTNSLNFVDQATFYQFGLKDIEVDYCLPPTATPPPTDVPTNTPSPTSTPIPPTDVPTSTSAPATINTDFMTPAFENLNWWVLAFAPLLVLFTLPVAVAILRYVINIIRDAVGW